MRPRVYGPRSLIDDDRAADVEVRHLRVGGQRKRAMRCGGSYRIEDLAAGGLPAHEVVPSSFPEQTLSSRAQRLATGAWDAVACCGLESCEPRLNRLATIACGPTIVSETARFIARLFSVCLGKAGGVAQIAGCALLWRLADGAGR